MKIGGKVTEWKVHGDEFTIDTPCGKLTITAEGCAHTLTDMLIDSMRDRRTIYIEAEEKSGKVNESQTDFLKPCPCCGSTRVHVVAPDDGCYCWDCGLTMPNRDNWRERWNRRPEE